MRPTNTAAAATATAHHGTSAAASRARTRRLRATAFIERSSPAAPVRANLAGIALLPAIALAVVALAGCGSVTSTRDLPPAAEPARSPPLTQRPAGRVLRVGTQPEAIAVGRATGTVAAVDGGRAVAVVSGRERVLQVYDARSLRRIARAPAGVGPTHVVAGPGHLIYVVDTTGDGLLVYELRPTLHLTRRLPLLGSPYGIAADPVHHRLWVTTTRTNRLVELADGARPHRLNGYATVRQPNTVAVNPGTGRVYVAGRADGVVQLLDPRIR